MGGIYYLLTIIAVFLVIHWYITNDLRQRGTRTHGLFAMRVAGDDARKEEQKANRLQPRIPPNSGA